MPLTHLHCGATQVADLSPLKGMPLTNFACNQTKVADLTPLKGMKLTILSCEGTQVSDLSLLKTMPLKELWCDFKPFRDTNTLSSIKSLERINNKPAKEFWQEVEVQQAAFEAWCKQVAALPAEKQVKAVAAKLKELNPDFDGKVTHNNENVVGTDLSFLTDNVTDISPVRALKGFNVLTCSGSAHDKSRLSDLSPLKGMPLTELVFRNSKVFDLSPLKGMKLRVLDFAGTPLGDLSPLKDIKLTILDCSWTQVADLSPLKDMKLAGFECNYTNVADLSPLKDMKLTRLNCAFTPVSDLSPLKDMKLTWLHCHNAKVSNLSPLKGMPLKELHCDFKPERDAKILRSIKTLETINGKEAKEFWREVDEQAQANDPLKNFTNSLGMKFVWIPPGSFLMGSPKEEKGREPYQGANETPHKVTLTKGVYMGVYAVTQEEWQAVMGNNPSRFKGEKNLPVETVSWDDCQDFIKKLREKEKKRYRLPTEAEWEYACRAGTTTPFYFGETIFSDQANYKGNVTYGNGKKGTYREKTTPVGTFQANFWGLHDMHGNVFQWCQDWFGDYPQNDVVDPQGPEKSASRVLRGGSWYNNPVLCRSAYRHRYVPGSPHSHFGFRLCFFVE